MLRRYINNHRTDLKELVHRTKQFLQFLILPAFVVACYISKFKIGDYSGTEFILWTLLVAGYNRLAAIVYDAIYGEHK